MDPDLNLDPPKGAGYIFAFYNLDPTHCKKRHQFEIFNTSDNQKVGDCPEVSWVCYIITYSVRGGRIGVKSNDFRQTNTDICTS